MVRRGAAGDTGMRARPASGDVCDVDCLWGFPIFFEGLINGELFKRVLPEWGMSIHSAAKERYS